MAMGKSFRIYEKTKPPNPYSIILEQRNYQQTLLFESSAVAELSKFERKIICNVLNIINVFNFDFTNFGSIVMKKIFNINKLLECS